MAAELWEALGRAVEEIGALEAIFGYEEGGFVVHSGQELAVARSTVEGDAEELPEEWRAPELEIELQLKLELEENDGVDDDRPTARLRCAMPPGYPAICSASVSVSIEGLRRGAADVLTARLSEKASSLLGDEAIMELVQELQEVAPELLMKERAALASAATSAKPSAAPTLQFGRRWIWAQTVTKPPNRAMAVNWANDLCLGGFLKPGSPGIFVFEGEAAACDDFIKQLKAVPNSCLRSVPAPRSAMPAAAPSQPAI